MFSHQLALSDAQGHNTTRKNTWPALHDVCSLIPHIFKCYQSSGPSYLVFMCPFGLPLARLTTIRITTKVGGRRQYGPWKNPENGGLKRHTWRTSDRKDILSHQGNLSERSRRGFKFWCQDFISRRVGGCVQLTCGRAALKWDRDNHWEIFMQAHRHAHLSVPSSTTKTFQYIYMSVCVCVCVVQLVREVKCATKKKLWAVTLCTLRGKSNDHHHEAQRCIPLCDGENHLSLCVCVYTLWIGVEPAARLNHVVTSISSFNISLSSIRA